MNNTVASKEKKTKKFNLSSIVVSSGGFYKLLLSLLWIQNATYTLIYRALLRIPYVTYIASSIFSILLIAFLAGSLPYIVKRCKMTELYIYVGLVVSVFATLALGTPAVESAILTDLSRIVVYTAPFIFVGAALVLEENEKLLNVLSMANVVTYIIYQFYYANQPGGLMSDNMSSAYYTLPSVAFLVYYSIMRGGVLNWIFVAASVALLFSFGTRGPLLCLLVFLIGILVYKLFSIKSLALRGIFLAVVGVVLYFLIFTDFIIEMFSATSELFGKMGFSTRIFDMFLEESITNDTGRGIIAERVLRGISENALFGYGVMGDRNFVLTYAHNVVYELWCSFGVIIGSLIFAAIVFIPLYAMIKTKQTRQRLFIWMLMATTIVKLFMSSSYLYEAELFLMIGYSFAVIRQSKNTVA